MRFRIFRTWNAPSLHAAPFQVIGNRPPSCFLRVWFGVRDCGEATLGHSPVIENARNVPHLIRPQSFETTQRKIVILRAFVAFTKTAYLAEHRRSINSEMVDVILPEEKLRIP